MTIQVMKLLHFDQHENSSQLIFNFADGAIPLVVREDDKTPHN